MSTRLNFWSAVPSLGMVKRHTGVPELIVPGKVFERKYNAKSVEDNGAGTVLPYTDFDAANIRALTEKTVRDRSFERNARSLGQKLLDAGGVEKIIDTFYRL